MISSGILPSVVLLACFLPLCLGQESSCMNRCGETYFRGYACHCDYECLIHSECCKDYETSCTTSNSCKGRCGETFKRGRQCNCDPECFKYNQCCPDFEAHCGKVSTTRTPDTTPTKTPKKDKPIEPPKKVPTDKAPAKGPIPTERPPLGDTDRKDLAVDEVIITTHSPPLNQQELQEQRDEAADNLTPKIPGSLAEAYSPEPIISLENTSGYESINSDLPGGVLPQDSMNPTSDTPAGATERGEVMEEKDVLVLRNQTDSEDNEIFSTTPAAVSPTHVSGQTPQGLKELTPHYHEEDFPSSTQSSMQDRPSTKPCKETVASDNQNLEKTPTTDTPLAVEITDKPRSRCTGEEKPLHSDSSAHTDSPEFMPTEHSKPTTPGQSLVLGVHNVYGTPTNASLNEAKTTEASIMMDADAASTNDDVNSIALPQPTALDPVPQPAVTPSQGSAEAQTPLFGTPTMVPLDPVSKPVQPVQTDATKDTKELPTVTPPEYLADDNDTNLCSGRPINGLTTLRNGTVVVFRGHYFWMLDANRVPGPARGITEVWGVPSPIDTVFTRCNCQHKTYIFKGLRYWRFENDVMDSGFPKTISDGFSGLSGKITAALSVPQSFRRPESVFFFKRGGLVQRYSYKHGTTPNCSKKVKYMVVTVRNRLARQAEVGLNKEVKITWRGFPSLVTAAISIPIPQTQDRYDYHIFSRTKVYNIKFEGDTPTLVLPVAAASQQNSAKTFFKCP